MRKTSKRGIWIDTNQSGCELMKSVLVIAGIDSSGGAGLLCDAAAVRAHQLHTKAVVTAVTAQGAAGVTHIAPMAPEAIAAQMIAAGPVVAVKIGMIATLPALETILTHLPDVPVVCDPVIAASSGTKLASPEVISNYPRLFARSALVTPNRPEAEVFGPILAPTLRKGGHEGGHMSTDVLFDGPRQKVFASVRLPHDRRGTGCTLSSAIACNLGLGDHLDEAIAKAKDYVTAYIQAAR